MSTGSLSSDDLSSSDFVDYTGKIINKKYKIIKFLGRGTFSSVWLAHNSDSKKFYAIKIQVEDYIDQGIEEAELAKKIKDTKSTDLMTIRDNFIMANEDGYDQICMLYDIMAGNLNDLLKMRKWKNGLPYETSIHILYQVLCGIKTLVTDLKVCHGDIKPENILIKGVSDEILEIQQKFTKLNFSKIRKKLNKKNRRRSKVVNNEMVLQEGLKQIGINIAKEDEYDSESESDESEEETLDELIRSSDEDESDEDESDSDEELDSNKITINDKIAKECNISISDFGSCQKINNLKDFDIQTRYYRAPELLIECPYDEKCDMWSVGCILYELLTGNILFNPGKTTELNRDRCHLYDIQRWLGPLRKKMLEKSRRKRFYYRIDGTIKGSFEYTYVSLRSKLEKDLKNIPTSKKDMVIDFIMRCLELDPSKRYSSVTALESPMFSNIIKKMDLCKHEKIKPKASNVKYKRTWKRN